MFACGKNIVKCEYAGQCWHRVPFVRFMVRRSLFFVILAHDSSIGRTTCDARLDSNPSFAKFRTVEFAMPKTQADSLSPPPDLDPFGKETLYGEQIYRTGIRENDFYLYNKDGF